MVKTGPVFGDTAEGCKLSVPEFQAALQDEVQRLRGLRGLHPDYAQRACMVFNAMYYASFCEDPGSEPEVIQSRRGWKITAHVSYGLRFERIPEEQSTLMSKAVDLYHGVFRWKLLKSLRERTGWY